MKLLKLCTIMIFLWILSGCDTTEPVIIEEKKDPKIELVSTDFTFIGNNLDLKTQIDGALSNNIVYRISGENLINARIQNGKLNADAPGTITIVATYSGVESEPQIITVMPKNESIINVILSTDLLKLDLGNTYSFGLDSLPKELYTVTSSNPEVLMVTDNNNITVIGSGRGTLKVINNKDNSVLYDDIFVVYNSILVTEIKAILINKGIIDSMASEITKKELDLITEINLERKLANDPSIAVGLKTLANLKKINLSYNNLKDIAFISELLKLEEIYLSNNDISDLTPLNQLTNLVKVDLSNNIIENISTFRRHQFITSLILTGNKINDLSPISTLYGLKKLFIGRNNVDSIDHISGLLEIEELDISYAHVLASDIFGLDYFNKLQYIDMSGISFTLSNVPKDLIDLKVLKLDNCDIEGIDYLLNYNSLEELSIASNNLDLVAIETFLSKIGTEVEFSNLKKLNIGGNLITSIPEHIQNLESLQELDLSNSYNLIELDNLVSIPWLKKLNLSNCNMIQNNVKVQNVFTILTNLESLSIVDGLNYIDRGLFDYLMERVSNIEVPFEVEIFDDEWIRTDTIVNYKSIIYFTFEELLSDLTETDGIYYYNYKKGLRKLIINLINDKDAKSSYNKVISFPKDIFEVNIYASKSNAYNVTFLLENRKQSTFIYNFYNFHNSGAYNNHIISAPQECTLNVNFFGECYMYAKTGYNAFKVNNINLDSTNATVIIVGGYGKDGASGANNKDSSPSSRKGGTGEKGYAAIYGNNVVLTGKGFTITGGVGGNGGKGGNSTAGTFNVGTCRDGGNGGAGGNGGVAINARTLSAGDNKLIGGVGGSGGAGGTNNTGVLIYKKGSKGSNGGPGATFLKIN